MPPTSYRDLIAWRRAMSLAQGAFTLAKTLRTAKQTGLAGQLERAGTSVPTNIAEGHGRTSRAEYRHFLSIAMGSLREVETLVQLSGQIGAAKNETVIAVLQLADEAGKVLFGLQRSLMPAVEAEARQLPPSTVS